MFALQSNSFPLPFNSSLFHSETNFHGFIYNVSTMYTLLHINDESVSTSSTGDTVFILQLGSI